MKHWHSYHEYHIVNNYPNPHLLQPPYLSFFNAREVLLWCYMVLLIITFITFVSFCIFLNRVIFELWGVSFLGLFFLDYLDFFDILKRFDFWPLSFFNIWFNNMLRWFVFFLFLLFFLLNFWNYRLLGLVTYTRIYWCCWCNVHILTIENLRYLLLLMPNLEDFIFVNLLIRTWLFKADPFASIHTLTYHFLKI